MAKPKLLSAVKDLTINQGDDFRFQITLKDEEGSPVDITGYTFRCKVSTDTESTDIVVMADTHIVNPTLGIVEFHFSDEDTQNIDTDGVTHDELLELAYDVQAIDPHREIKRLLCGKFYVSPTISWKGENDE